MSKAVLFEEHVTAANRDCTEENKLSAFTADRDADCSEGKLSAFAAAALEWWQRLPAILDTFLSLCP